MTAKLSDTERTNAAQIVALFSVLVHAWHTGDLREATQTRATLKRMGVKVDALSSCRPRTEVPSQ